MAAASPTATASAAFGELTPALACFLFIYIAALVVLFISAFWTVNEFTGELEHVWTTVELQTIFHSSAYRTIALRTIGIAAAVTVADALLAFPFAYYMARVASRGGARPLRRACCCRSGRATCCASTRGG